VNDGGGCLIEPAELIAPGQAQRLAEVRKASGREIPELAGLLEISYEAYEDLELFDEEIVDALSLNQLIQLAAALRLDLRSFFDARNLGHVTFVEFAAQLQRLLADGTVGLSALEDRVGWELRRHLEAPDTFGELPAIALADIGGYVGVDWRSFLPLSAASSTR
jgi:transcriptional regulator with XRE-family HTH domain